MAEKVGLLRRVWRFFGGIFSFIYKLLRGLVLLWLLIVIGGVIVAVNNRPQPPASFVLDLNVSGDIVEDYKGNPSDLLLASLSGEPPSQTIFSDLIKVLDAAQQDTRVLALNINTDGLGAIYPGQLFELVAALQRFKSSGKPVYAHAEYHDRNSYLLAAQADKVQLDPLGAVFIEGYSSYQNYYKEALETLGVTANVFRAGTYKSAVEPFLRNDMSPEAKEANQRWLNVLWANYKAGLFAARQQASVFDLEQYLNSPQRFISADKSPAEAVLALQLVDELNTRRQYEQWLREQYGDYYDGYEDTYPRVSSQHYQTMLPRNALKLDSLEPETAKQQHSVEGETIRQDTQSGAGAVAVLGLDGAIMDYDENGTDIDAQRAAGLLDWVAEEDYYQALVIRVNSPGGTISASEHIRRAVLRVQQAGKPVVISMSGMAASGGYWISAPADSIIANANTITGSIGVFGVLPTIDKGLNKLGVYTDGVGTSAMSGVMHIDRPMSDATTATMQGFIDNSYQVFLGTVADGREMPVEQVRRVAEGRVWVGQDAKENGLVDELGGLHLAVEMAAQLAELDQVHFEVVRDQQSLMVEKMLAFTRNVSLPTLASASLSATGPSQTTTALQRMLAGSAKLLLKPLVAAASGSGKAALSSYAYCACNIR